MKDVYQKIIDKLRTPRYGHGAFGEPERYDPSQQDLFLASLIENLALQVDMREIQIKVLEKEVAELKESPTYDQDLYE